MDDCTKPQARKHTPDCPIFEPYTGIEIYTHIDVRHIDNKDKVIKNFNVISPTLKSIHWMKYILYSRSVQN